MCTIRSRLCATILVICGDVVVTIIVRVTGNSTRVKLVRRGQELAPSHQLRSRAVAIRSSGVWFAHVPQT